ncbi:MAG TPA: AsmA-like C-terminal region-containing protein [Thermodesulfobacteriota bacterium]|nr:AsmA-like C-terminal region-containing protein [Thermodesulfobacteriota bacterium]
MAKAFKRPIAMGNLAFSWKDGFFISQLNITNHDRTPLLVLHSVQLLPDWRALLTRKFKAASLTIEGIALTIIRDKTGKIMGDDLVASLPQERTGLADKESSTLTPTDAIAPRPKKKSGIYKGFSALFLDAHIKEGVFTFIDQRLNTTTQIKNFSADLNVRSLTKPIKFLLQGTVVLNNNPPEPLRISGSALLFSKEKMNLPKARGTLTMEAGFGHVEGFFDLDKFNTSSFEATGGRLVCSLDLDKVSQVLAGVLGFPPGYSWKGNFRSSLEARGNFDSRIAITGATQLTNVSITGGPFQRAPFEQPRIDSSQKILLNFPTHEIKVKLFDLKSDFLKLSLAGAINNFQKTPYSNLMLSGTGDLHEVVHILGNFFHLPPDLNLSGITQLSLSGTGPAKKFHLKGAVVVRGLSVEHPALKGRPFQEETLRISPDLLCNFKKNQVTITSLLIRGKSLAGEIKGAVDGQSDIGVEGTLSLKFAELKKQLPDVLPRGFPSEGESSSDFTIKGNLKNSIVMRGDHNLPLLPKLKVTHDLIYSPEQDTLTFTTLTAESPCLNFNGQGTITQISKNPFATSEGKLALALEEAQKVWKDSLPKKMILQGNGSLTFTAEGKLKPVKNKPVLSSWIGNGTVFLDAMSYQGLGTIQNLKSAECTLDKGVLKLALKGLLNNGPATAQGAIDFNQKRPAMNLKGQGKNIELSQKQTLLGYVIPISSRSTQLTGKGSFFLQASWQGTDWEQEISRNVRGEGKISLNDGTIKSEGALSEILSVLGKSDTIQFDQILSPFRLGEGKIYDNTIQVTGPDIELALQGWTSLIYDPEKKGNPIKYKVTGASLKQSLGKDAQKILPFLGNNDSTIPMVISGTVQKPKVSVKFPKAKKFFKDFFNPPKDSFRDLDET